MDYPAMGRAGGASCACCPAGGARRPHRRQRGEIHRRRSGCEVRRGENKEPHQTNACHATNISSSSGGGTIALMEIPSSGLVRTSG
eukprot:gene15058-biopygen21687